MKETKRLLKDSKEVRMMVKVCGNCGHPIRTNKDRGITVSPNKAFHWIENYGSRQCPHCDCFQPLLLNPSKRYKRTRNGMFEEIEEIKQLEIL